MRKLAVYSIVLFMLGFPAVGLLYFWQDGHTRVRVSAAKAARAQLPQLLGPGRASELEAHGTFDFRQAGGPSKAVAELDRFGPFLQLGEVRAVSSHSTSRRDYVWHFVGIEAEAEFQGGPAAVELTLARKTVAPEWRVDRFAVRPRKSGG